MCLAVAHVTDCMHWAPDPFNSVDNEVLMDHCRRLDIFGPANVTMYW